MKNASLVSSKLLTPITPPKCVHLQSPPSLSTIEVDAFSENIHGAITRYYIVLLLGQINQGTYMTHYLTWKDNKISKFPCFLNILNVRVPGTSRTNQHILVNSMGKKYGK